MMEWVSLISKVSKYNLLAFRYLKIGLRDA